MMGRNVAPSQGPAQSYEGDMAPFRDAERDLAMSLGRSRPDEGR